MNSIDFKIKNLAKIFEGKIIGDENLLIKGISSIENAKQGDLTFLSNKKYSKYLEKSKASSIVIDKSIEIPKNSNKTFLIVEDSYMTFTLILTEVNKKISKNKKGIEDPNFINKKSKIGKETYIGAFSYIGEGVEIGDSSKIYPYSYIGDNVKIGNNSIIYPGVKIYNDTEIGNNCSIHANAVIGSDGFGFAPNSKNEYTMIPQVGNVLIEDNVSIGSNTVIDRATLDSTIIKKGSKLDNLIQVAHNVKIGENSVIAAQSGIAGSSTIGKNSMIGGQVGIIGHLNLGDNIQIGAKSGIIKSFNSNKPLYGNPAMEKGKFLKSYVIFKKLPEIQEKIKKIEKILNK